MPSVMLRQGDLVSSSLRCPKQYTVQAKLLGAWCAAIFAEGVSREVSEAFNPDGSLRKLTLTLDKFRSWSA